MVNYLESTKKIIDYFASKSYQLSNDPTKYNIKTFDSIIVNLIIMWNEIMIGFVMGTDDLKICDQTKFWQYFQKAFQVFLNHLFHPLAFSSCCSFYFILCSTRWREYIIGEMGKKYKTRGEKSCLRFLKKGRKTYF